MSTILAVDDSATMRKCLEITFEGTEFNLVTCDSASAAVEQVKTLAPALVIADVSLPPNDGYELCSTIKLASPATPVLMLSSKQNPFDPGKGAQADDHIDKPFDTQVLQDRARQLINAAPKSDTEVPGRAAAAQKPVAVPPTPAAGSKIPAPRRKRPTPAMMQQPSAASQTPKPGVAAAGRRTVPFAMPNKLKQTTPGGIAADIVKRPAAPSAPIAPTPPSPPPQQSPAVAAVPAAKPTETLPGVPGDGAPAAAAVALPQDLQGKLVSLGLTHAQIEGVLALSREVVEQVVWEVVPHLAEQMIQEEIARLTKE